MSSNLRSRLAVLEQRRREATAVEAAAVAADITPAEAAAVYARLNAETTAHLSARVGPPRYRDIQTQANLYRDFLDGKPVDDRF